MSATENQVAELIKKGWRLVSRGKSLYINEPLFEKGIISLLDPSNFHVLKTEENGPFAVSKDRSIIFLKDAKSGNKAKRLFNLPDTTVNIRNTKRRDECYVPVIVKSGQGKVAAGLYIHPREISRDDSLSHRRPFTAFHAETCLLGSQLSCRTDKGSLRHFTKHNVEFFEGERIVSITSSPGENSYEMMQFEELQLMAVIMAGYSLKGLDGKPNAQVTHHLPWLDYILSGALLWYQGHMTYQALRTLCEVMILKKIEHEEKIGTIYRSLGLKFRFITPFDNLLDPTKDISADSILDQLGIDEREIEPQLKEPCLETIKVLCEHHQSNLDNGLLQQLLDDLKRKKEENYQSREKLFVHKYREMLRNNTFNPEQKKWWIRLSGEKIAANGIETLEELLELANTLALAISASPGSEDSESSNFCSFVSTQGKQIQIVYEKLFKFEELKLPSVTCWTSLPVFLTNSQTTLGATFYFEYLAHAKEISELIGRNIVGGAISNMMAWMNGKKGKSVKCYLDADAHTPRHHHFFRPISDEIAEDIVAMPGTRTCGEMPGMFFQINGLTEYTQEMNDDIIIGYEQMTSLHSVNLGSSFIKFGECYPKINSKPMIIGCERKSLMDILGDIPSYVKR